jgi:D-alanine-D-alanine ligase
MVMPNRISLALLYGGKSGEHEISLMSAASVLANLDREKYKIIPIGMDKDGHFFINDYEELLNYKDSLPVSTARSQLLPSLQSNGCLTVEAEVVFPIVHGPLYEDGCLQGLLELADVAYVGSDVLASSLSMDKDITRRLACINDIKSAKYKVLNKYSSKSQREVLCQRIIQELGLPLFVKPCCLGSSVGIHKAHNLQECLEALDDAFRYDDTALVEEFIQGKEIELAVLENRDPEGAPKVSVAGELHINHKDGFYSYTAKYLESTETKIYIPARIDNALTETLQVMAANIFSSLKCKGMARVDFFVNDQTGEIRFNELNTLPGFTTISMYPKLWQASGLEYTQLLDELIALALIRKRSKEQLVTSYQ